MADDREIVKPKQIDMERQPKDARDRTDLNHEKMGEGTNRICCYLTNDAQTFFGEDKEKKTSLKHLYRLQQLPLDDTQREASIEKSYRGIGINLGL